MKPSRGGEPIVRSLIWKFVPDELIRWNDAAGLSSEQLIMVDQVSRLQVDPRCARDHSKEGFLGALRSRSDSRNVADHAIHSRRSRFGGARLDIHVELGKRVPVSVNGNRHRAHRVVARNDRIGRQIDRCANVEVTRE